MITRRFTIETVLICTATSFVFCACSNSSTTSLPISQMQQTRSTLQLLSPQRRMAARERAEAKNYSGNSNCILIDTVFPNSDFHGLGFTAAAVSGGDHLHISATGCTYGIYLYPGAPNLHIDHAIVTGAYRVPIFAEDVSGVTIDHTVVNGTSAGKADLNTIPIGGIAFRGAGGTVTNTVIYNASVFGMNVVANDACEPSKRPPFVCLQSHVTVDHVIIDNSATTGDGFDIAGGPYPQLSSATISHSTVIGPNSSTIAGDSEVDNYGAQVGFASFDGNLNVDFDSAIHDQIGFDVICSTSNVANLAALAKQHDSVSVGVPVSLPQSPIPENQVLNVISVQQEDAAFGAGYC
jgi:hypothetical protein